MDQCDTTDFGKAIAQAVLDQYKMLPKTGKPQPNEYTVLAGFVVTEPQPSLDQMQQTGSPVQGLEELPAQHDQGTMSLHGPVSRHVVSLGTGTKCLSMSKRSQNQDVLNDSHAEVIARRAFLRWIYTELDSVAAGCAAVSPSMADCSSSALSDEMLQDAHPMRLPGALSAEDAGKAEQQPGKQRSSRQPLFERTASGKFRKRGLWQLHMFITQPPCGDACIFSDQAPTETGCGNAPSTGWRRTGAKRLKANPAGAIEVDIKPPCGAASNGQHIYSAESNESKQGNSMENAAAIDGQHRDAGQTVSAMWEGQRQEVGVLRLKPGRGELTRSLSCSDKLARWTLLGLQGAMLSELLEEPLYMQSLTVALPNCTHTSVEQARAALWRAVVGRTEGVAKLLPFKVNPPILQVIPLASFHSEPLRCTEVRSVPSGLSLNWSASLSTDWRCTDHGTSKGGLSEATLAASGRKAGAAKKGPGWTSPKTQSRISTASLLDCYSALASENRHLDLTPKSFRQLKLSSVYQQAWTVVRSQSSVFERWYSSREPGDASL